MKISCQSCGAKYTIADEKVRGRTVKIRCKKCSSAIVISGAEMEAANPPDEEDPETKIFENQPATSPFAGSAAAQAPVEWTVNVAEGDQRTVHIDEIVQLYRSGVINDDTYLWRDGMGDWLPLGEVPELVEKVRGAPLPAAGKSPSIAPRPVAAATPSPEQVPAPVAAAAAASAAVGAGGPALAAAQGSKAAARRVEGRAKDQDLFGGSADAQQQAAAAAAAKGHMTAERSENSVLFTLDALKAPKSNMPPAHAQSSGVVDIMTLASSAPAPVDSDRAINDIMGMGGGSIMGAATLAAPVLPTVPEPEPPPPPPPVPEYMGMGPMPAQPTGGNKMLVIILAAALGLVVIAFGGYLVFGRSKANAGDSKTNPTASATPTETSTSANTAPTSTDTAAGAAGAGAGGAAPTDTSTAKAEDKKDPKAATDKVPGKLDTSKSDPSKTDPYSKTDKTKADDKKVEDKKTEEKTPPAPEPGGGGTAPFDRSAAVAALNAAASAASGCKKPDGPTGTGRVSVTFAPTGRVTSANVTGPPFAGTSVGGCVAARFRSASIPPFSGGPMTVGKSFTIN